MNKTKAKELEQYVKERKIFIDTCSILHPKIEDFWEVITPLLKKHKKKVFVASAIYRELEKHANNKSDAHLSRNARRCLAMINRLLEDDVIEIRGEKDEVFADNVFLYVFTKFRLTYKLLLITQDRALARDIDSLNLQESVKNGKSIYVKRLNNKAQLEDINFS